MLQIELSPEDEVRLRTMAAAVGKEVAEIVIEAVEEKLSGAPAPSPANVPPEEWAARLDTWAASHRRLGFEVDASRESIYAGRGE